MVKLLTGLTLLLGVLQGCVLTPLLFNIAVEVVLALALVDNDIRALISGMQV